MMLENVVPAIIDKFPQSKTLPITTHQEGNAKPHGPATRKAITTGFAQSQGCGLAVEPQPPNSPDYNVLDLGFSHAIQALAALQFYRGCCKALVSLGSKRDPAEPCLPYKYVKGNLITFMIWVDDCMVCGPKGLVLGTIKQSTSLWDCKGLGELEEYVGCKVERTSEMIRLTQPVEVQRFQGEFGCKGDNGPSHRAPTTPAEPGSVLEYDKGKDKGQALSPPEQGVGWYFNERALK